MSEQVDTDTRTQRNGEGRTPAGPQGSVGEMSLRKCPHKSLSLALRLEGLLRHSLRAEVQSTFKRGRQEKRKVRVPRVVAAPELTRLIRGGPDMGVGGSVCPGRSSPPRPSHACSGLRKALHRGRRTAKSKPTLGVGASKRTVP